MSLLPFGKIKAMFGDIVAKDAELSKGIETAQAKISEIKSAPLAMDDYIANGHAAIDKLAESYISSLQNQVNSDMQRSAMDFVDAPTLFTGFCPSYPEPRNVTPAALAALCGPMLKEKYTEAIRKLPWPKKTGLPLVKRQELIAELEREVADLTRQQTELRQEAKKSGLGEAMFTDKRAMEIARQAKESGAWYGRVRP